MSLGSSVARKVGAKVYLTSEDEWYKAAYYKGGGTSAGYWFYPADPFWVPTCTVPGATANTANCGDVIGDLADVGGYTGAASPNGTFDQGGNVWEWNETMISGAFSCMRGGGFSGDPRYPAAFYRYTGEGPEFEIYGVGFRVASSVPAPSVPALGPIGLLLAAAGLLGFGAYLGRRA
jgi:formylglycine-generating enzyme required for sulfatase activity